MTMPAVCNSHATCDMLFQTVELQNIQRQDTVVADCLSGAGQGRAGQGRIWQDLAVITRGIDSSRSVALYLLGCLLQTSLAPPNCIQRLSWHTVFCLCNV